MTVLFLTVSFILYAMLFFVCFLRRISLNSLLLDSSVFFIPLAGISYGILIYMPLFLKEAQATSFHGPLLNTLTITFFALLSEKFYLNSFPNDSDLLSTKSKIPFIKSMKTVFMFVPNQTYAHRISQLNTSLITLVDQTLPVHALITMMAISLLFITQGMKITKPSLSVYLP